MEIVLFILYLLAIAALVTELPFFKKSGLKRPELLLLFAVKIAAGLAYAFFYKTPKYYARSDTWRFHRLSFQEKEWLLKDPAAFIKDLFVHGYDRTGGLFSGENSYWNDLKSNVIIKLLALMNVITNSSYYTNVILFNFLFLFGLVALFRLFYSTFPNYKWLIVFGLFLLPSTLFWCSGIHKDGLILSALGIIIYYFSMLITQIRIKVSKLVIIILCIVLIFTLRNYVAIALLPALFCWWLSSRLQRNKWLPFLIVYPIGLVLFFSVKYLHPSLDFPAHLAQKQYEFSLLEGTSTVINKTFKPTLTGFIQFLPKAIDMAFLRPHITEAKSLNSLAAALENILLIAVILVAVFLRRKGQGVPSLVYFCLFFSVSLLMLSGYTITLSGAIVRYRSISLPLIITPLLCLVDFQKMKDKVFSKKRSISARQV